MHNDDEDDDDLFFDIDSLIRKYDQMRIMSKKIYFDADEFAALADYLHSADRHEEADELIRQGLAIHPGNTELLAVKAKSLIFNESYDEAYEILQVLDDEDDVDWQLMMVECLFNMGKRSEAYEFIDKGVKDQDKSSDEYYFFITEVGFLLNDFDDFDGAIKLLEESLEYDNKNKDVLTDLAYAYEMKSDFKTAIKYDNMLLDTDPYSYSTWLNVGKLHSINEEYDKAIDAFDFALTIDENDTSALKMKALTLYLNDNLEEAINIFEECLSKAPNDETLYDSLIEAYEAIELYDKEIQLLDEKEKKFGSKGVMIRRVAINIARGEYEEAIKLFEQVPPEERETVEYYMMEGELYLYNDKLLESEASLMKALLISSDNEAVIDRLANVSVARGLFRQAAEYLEQLLELDPDFPTAKVRLALVRFEIGTKEPFDKLIESFSDEELIDLLSQITNLSEREDLPTLNREKILIHLNEARENRVLFKNIKY